MAFRIEPANFDFGPIAAGESNEIEPVFLDVPPDIDTQFTATFQLGDQHANFTGLVNLPLPDVTLGELDIPPEFEENNVDVEVLDLSNDSVIIRVTRGPSTQSMQNRVT